MSLAIDELFGRLDSGAVVGATQIDGPNELAVQTHDVHAIMMHLRTPDLARAKTIRHRLMQKGSVM